MSDNRLILPSVDRLKAHIQMLSEELSVAKGMLKVAENRQKEREGRPLQSYWERNAEAGGGMPEPEPLPPLNPAVNPAYGEPDLSELVRFSNVPHELAGIRASVGGTAAPMVNAAPLGGTTSVTMTAGEYQKAREALRQQVRPGVPVGGAES